MAWSCTLINAEGDAYELHDVANGKALQRLTGRGFPSPNRFVVDPAVADGALYKSMRYGARLMEAYHVLQGSTYDDLMDKRLELAAVIAPKSTNVDGSTMTLRWRADAGSPAYEIDVQIAAELGFDGHAGLNTELYTIPFVADNPFWRKLPAVTTTLNLVATGLSVPISVPISLSSANNSVNAVNDGNAISYPTITITAGGAGAQNPKIVNTTTGETVQVNYIMDPADVMVIDMQARSITLNGSTSIIHYRTAASVSWGLVGGTNVIEAFLAAGTATFEFSYHDLYIAI